MTRRMLILPALLLLIGLAVPLRGQEAGVCFECHNDPSATGARGDTLYVNSERWTASVHAQAGLECTACHQDLAGVEDWPHPETLQKVDCSACHDKAMLDWTGSVHGKAARDKGDLDAAGCADCHGSHYILPVKDPQSPVYPSNLPATCLRCHADSSLGLKHEGMGKPEKASLYLGSVHAQALEKRGLVISATCASCHGSHNIQPLDKFLENIPRTCGECHAGIYRDYVEGVHGAEYLKGNRDVPLCTDCHGEHDIRPPDDPESKVNPRQLAQVCSRCHEDQSLSAKYGLPLGRLDSYMTSYHGVALKLGDMRVANCASCHGFHNIRPSSDPKSPVNPANLAATCGKCHPNAGENFAKGKIHVQGQPHENLGAWLVKRAYVLLILALVGGFVGYIVLDLTARRRRRAKGEDKTRDPEKKP